MSEPLGRFAVGPTGAPLAGEAAREPEDKEHMKQTVSVADKELERLLAEAYEQGWRDAHSGKPHRNK